jgi:hypothetical protein
MTEVDFKPSEKLNDKLNETGDEVFDAEMAKESEKPEILLTGDEVFDAELMAELAKIANVNRADGKEEMKMSIKDFEFFGPVRLEAESYEEYRLRRTNENYMRKMRDTFGLHNYNSRAKGPWKNPERIKKKIKNGTLKVKDTVNRGPFFVVTNAYRKKIAREEAFSEKKMKDALAVKVAAENACAAGELAMPMPV